MLLFYYSILQRDYAGETAHWALCWPIYMCLVLGAIPISRWFLQGTFRIENFPFLIALVFVNSRFCSHILISGSFILKYLFEVNLWTYLELRFLIIPWWFDFDSVFSSHLFLAAAGDCFSNTLSFPSCSRGDHFLGLHPSWNATFNGHWGKVLT